MKIRTINNAERICALLAEGYTLRQIARELSFRSASAIVNWANEDTAFRERYAGAMELRCARMAEEILEISDNASNDWMEREGLTVPDHENVQRSRLAPSQENPPALWAGSKVVELRDPPGRPIPRSAHCSARSDARRRCPPSSLAIH